MSSKPINTKLYESVKKSANKRFKSPSGIYRSAWIVKEYKKRGGKYSGKKSGKIGLKRWFKENWVDLNRPIRNSLGKVIGYKKCGRKSSLIKGKYPLCRPSKKITKKTPTTYKKLSQNSIKKAKKMKSIYTFKKNIRFKTFAKKSHKKKPVKKSVKKSHKKKSIKKSVKKPVKKSHKKKSIKKSAKKSVKKSHKKKSIKKSVKMIVKE